jgi:hypothetical protein
MRLKHKGYRLPKLKYIVEVIGTIFLLIMWALILLNPVLMVIHYNNPLYLFFYVLLPAEFFVGALISGLIIKIIET